MKIHTRMYICYIACLLFVFPEICVANSLASLKQKLRNGVVATKSGNHSEAISIFKDGLYMAQQMGNKIAVGAFSYNIGRSYKLINNYKEAIEYLSLSLRIRTDLNNQSSVAKTLGMMSLVFSEQEDYSKSYEYAMRSLNIREQIGEFNKSLKNIVIIALSLNKLGRHDDSIEYYKRALGISKRVNDYEAEAISYFGLGEAYLAKDSYDESKLYYEKAYRFWDSSGNSPKAYESLLRIGNSLLLSGNVAKANTIYEKALNYYRVNGSKEEIGNVFELLGTANLSLFKYDIAIENFDKAYEIFYEINDNQKQAHVLSGLGSSYGKIGKVEKAVNYFQRSLDIYKNLENEFEQAGQYSNIGIIQLEIGEYEKAIESLSMAVKLARNTENHECLRISLSSLSDIYYDLKMYDKAYSYLNEGLKASRNTKRPKDKVFFLIKFAKFSANEKKYEEAISNLNLAKKIALESKNKYGLNRSLALMGVINYEIGEHDSSLEYLNKAIKIADDIGIPNSDVLFYIGGNYLKKNNWDKAKEYFDKSIETAKYDLGLIAKLKSNIGQILLENKNYYEAVKTFKECINIIENIRGKISHKDIKTIYMSSKYWVYDSLINALYQLNIKCPGKNYDKEAFGVFEKKQGRIFIDEISKTKIKNFSGVPDEIIENEIYLNRYIDKLREDLAQVSSSPSNLMDAEKIKSINMRIHKTENEILSFKRNLQIEYPAYHTLKYPSAIQLRELQNVFLQPDEMLLAYNVSESEIFLWVIGRKHYSFHRLNIEEKKLQSIIQHYRDDLLNVPNIISQNAFERNNNLKLTYRKYSHLFNLLIPNEVIKSINKANQIIIVPTGPLYLLPFETIKTEQSSTEDTYFVKNHAISYLSSASLLKLLRGGKNTKNGKLKNRIIAFANPNYSDKNNFSLKDMRRNKLYRSDFGGKFPPLPETEDEVKEIFSIMGVNSDINNLHLGSMASRSKVLNLNNSGVLPGYRYIVFACHGIMPGEVDEVYQPALILSNPDPVSHGSGFLTMSDVYSLRVNSSLVSLSACNTGRGEIIKGEGVSGMTRAFLYAGSSAVTVTLWSVESESAKKLNVDFFSRIHKNESLTNALRNTKLDMIDGKYGKLYQHPFFWAPVVLFGDGN